MDYEKKYNEALNDMRVIYTNLKGDAKLAVEHAFPELRESEDERIRKWLIDYFSSIKATVWIHRDITCEQILEWLEKQKPMYNLEIPSGDVAPAEEDGPFDEDDFLENELSAFLQNYDKEYDDDAAVSDVARHFYEIGKKQKEQKPAEWSKEDEKMIERLITRLNWITYNTRTDGTSPNITFFDEIDWLKSLRPSWKPSEEQMNALNFAITYMFSTKANPTVLRDLYNDLLKLK